MSDTPGFDAKQLRTALGAFSTGVTIITTRGDDGLDYGLTANSFNSVSMDPPLVLWSLSHSASSAPAFINSSHFAVHVLAADQTSLSNQFAKSGGDKFAGLPLTRGAGDVPLLQDCSARFECRAVHQYEGGDHVILVGEVLSFEHRVTPPLVFHSGGYRQLQQPTEYTDATSQNDWLGFLFGRGYYQMQLLIRQQLAHSDLQDSDYELLAILSLGDGRTADELYQLHAFIGKQLTPEHLDNWVARGLLVFRQEDDGPKRVYFTADGKHLGEQWLNAARSAEIRGLECLDLNETLELRRLLGKVIQHTGADLPTHWRKEKIWKANNLWQQVIN
jgi:3-hydroxy-9,10-secoandrosta-1,3,5(10)-triene-9,17-dione monooxygenase reductase component